MKHFIILLFIGGLLYVTKHFPVAPRQIYANNRADKQLATLKAEHRLKYITKLLGGREQLAQTFVAVADRNGIDAAVLIGVWRAESSLGVHDSCKAFGKVNGYGLGIFGDRHDCFDSFEEVTEAVAYTLTQAPLYRDKPLKERLCIYNRGTAVDDCGYAERVLKYAYE